MRDELCAVLGDVDRVTMNVNVGCDLRNPQNYRPGIFITRYSRTDDTDGAVKVASNVNDASQSERLLEYLREQGFPVEAYQPPQSFHYYLGEHAYLGTIFLWREHAREAISKTTLDTMAQLEPFFIFALSDLVARRQNLEPTDRTFLDAMQSLSGTARLSKQEERVIILQLFGHSYKEIADMLGVSVDGVKHHLKMVHRKTGARSYTELFAKYFMPRLDLRDEEDETQAGAVEESGEEETIEDAPSAIVLPGVSNGPAPSFMRDSSLGDRLRKYGDVVYNSVEEFARALKIAPSNLQKYFNGERNPGLAMLQRLYELGCNINGLISGEGRMFADNDSGHALSARLRLSVHGELPMNDAAGTTV